MSKYSDMTERLLDEKELPTPYQPSREERLTTHWLSKLVGGFIVAIGVWMIQSGYRDDWPSMIVGAIVVVGGMIWLYSAERTTQHLKDIRFNEMEFERTLIVNRLGQRPGLVDSLTKADVEKYRAKGAFSAQELLWLRQQHEIQLTRAEEQKVREWEAQEAKKVRDFAAAQTTQAQQHESFGQFFQQLFSGKEADKQRRHEATEAERNRRYEARQSTLDRESQERMQRSKHRHTLEALDKTIAKELQIWESRVKVEHPNEVQLTKERLAAWQLVAAELKTVVDENDEDFQTHLLRAFEKRMSSMYGK